MDDTQNPRIMRLTIIGVWADGSSNIVDIPVPEKISWFSETEFLDFMEIVPFSKYAVMPPSATRLVMDLSRSNDIQYREMPVPYPGMPDGDKKSADS